MSISEIIALGTEYFSIHPWIAILAVAAVLGLLYWNSKAMVRILGILLLFAVLYYLFSFIGESTSVGVDVKRKMLENRP
ncbi:MAG: hypothetical protein ACOZF0_03770 [Thermodesulfobacteriota bacterium]